MSKTITRSTVNENQYSAPEFPKSGFNLGYRDYSDYILGRWQVSGYQWCMPSDKISGHNKGNFTFNRIVTPMVAPVHVGQYNVYCTLRSIDNTFQENVAPSKHNGYSADWRMPMTNTSELVSRLIHAYHFDETSFTDQSDQSLNISDAILAFLTTSGTDRSKTLSQWTISALSANVADFGSGLYDSLRSALLGENIFATPPKSLYAMAVDMYAVDALKDVYDFWCSRFGADLTDIQSGTIGSMNVADFFYLFFECLFTPFLGRYSYYCDFGYNFIRPSDIYRLSHTPYTVSNITEAFDNTPMNEYPLRAMYAFWYDRCRDVNLQPVSSTLPNPRKFGSTSIFDVSAGGNLIYLMYRIRRWSEDMFISAQCDSPSRHIYAPIYTRTSYTQLQDTDIDSLYAQDNLGPAVPGAPKVASQLLSFLDPLTGVSSSINCPVPSFVNDALSRATGHLDSYQVYGLGLQNLRQAQNLERYLKRLDYFGDEYNDYMLAQYNSRVSDLRINHPEILSQSYDDANYEQEIANMSNDVMQAGTRTATGTISSGGDGFTTFTEEFGIVINVISFMPEASYDNACPQLLMSRLVDLPLPIFAANNDELGRIMEIAANGLSPAINGDDADYRFMFGHYPAYHAWRSRVDRVRGSFLNERQDCLFRRFYGMYDAATTPRLNYEFINCRPNLQMFANTVRYDGQLYGDVVHECYVERVLPTPVETI